MTVDVADEGAAIALSGQLDVRRSAEVRERLYAHIGRHPGRDVVMDLTGVESIDATTLRMFAAAALRVERTGRRVVLRGCSPTLRRVLAHGGWRRFLAVERGAAQR
jgi:anti-anti-sigma factor